jgi:hypothetical protein
METMKLKMYGSPDHHSLMIQVPWGSEGSDDVEVEFCVGGAEGIEEME